jgi:hypothetical protein
MNLPFKLGGKLAKGLAMARIFSPELCAAGSILFGLGCVITSCMATVKSEPAVKDCVEREEAIRKVYGEGDQETMRPVKDLSVSEQKAVNDIRKDMAVVLVKNFALPLALGVASVALQLHGLKVLRKTLTATTLALAAKTKELDEYRKRVIEDQGIEKDQEYMHGLKKETSVVVDPETGEVLEEKTKYKQVQPGISQYARVFDEGEWDEANKKWIWHNPVWKDDNVANQDTLRYIEREMNGRLVRDGYLFLNDVYKRLGFPPTIDGQIVGWMYDSVKGDHGVSFGVFTDDPRQLPCNLAFIDGDSNTPLLDFNVDGPIINELGNIYTDEHVRQMVAYNT